MDTLSIDEAQAEAPEAGARDGLSGPQRILLLATALFAAFVGVTAASPVTWFMLAASALFLAVIGVLLGAAVESLNGPAPDLDTLATEERRAWPRYSILVPLYREAAVARQLTEAMAALDYPADRLDILFLVESDDAETAAALRASLPGNARVIVVPEGAPRTKPRALNYGLARSLGQYITVFDAEDLPEPDQLKRAVLLFERSPRRFSASRGVCSSTISRTAGCR